MPTQQPQSAHERQPSADILQMADYRDLIRSESVRWFLEIVPEETPAPAVEAPVRVVKPTVTNPLVQHAMGQPSMEDEARRNLSQIYGEDNDHQAAA